LLSNNNNNNGATCDNLFIHTIYFARWYNVTKATVYSSYDAA